MAREFVHLHLHSQYSLLDGAIRFEELFPLLEAYRMRAVALTDHGNMFGAIEFYHEAQKHGVKPILGCEVYVAPKSRFEREGDPYHMILLAMDAEGYRNLSHLVSLGYLEGFYHKPRIDWELLERHHRGLIAMTSCLKGEIPSLLLQGRYEEAKERAGRLKELFDDGRFYLELQDNGLEEQKRVNEGLVRLSRDVGVKLVASNDCHYLRRSDAMLHDVLLCIQTGKNLRDPKRLRFSSDQFHLRPPEEMEALFSHVPEALSNTLEVAERCNLQLQFGHYHLPQFEPPEGTSLEEYLRELATKGLQRRLTQRGIKDEAPYWQRLSEELDVIISMGFAGYFLIVADFVNYAKGRGIPVGPGRGSAAGSLVAYALGITDIDPLEQGLLFERFLNPERVSLPDIDVDFCYEGRDEVIRYVMEKYGHDKVAQIITFGKMQARAVVRDVGRVLGLPYREVDIIAKLIPGGPNVTLQEALEVEPRLRELAARDERVSQLLDFAQRLEGMVRHASTHAAGVVIANRPLMDYLPLYRAPGGEVTTQYAMKDVERIGLVKFDFLGLKTLTMMRRTVELIRRKGEEVDLGRLSLEDKQTYRLLGKGDTTGVFQLESQGMRELLRKLKPSDFRDLVALVALYRPGPLGSGMVEDFIKRRHKKKGIEYLHPTLKEVLQETYGVIVYQEQVMMAASRLADFSLGEADLLRRAMSKKDPEEMARLRARFVEGAIRKGLERRRAEEIFDLMAKFAEYGFNKSHSAAYALVAYQTAYLKAHYPQEFMAALLTSDMGNSDKVMRYISECREKGIEVLPPDVNRSGWEFTVEGEDPPKIRYGLGAIKNVGRGAVEAILEARQEGPFRDLFDFLERVDSRRVNRKVVESLIKAGAFGSTGAKRSQLMAVLSEAIELSSKGRGRKGQQSSLFGPMETPKRELPEMEEWPEGQLLQAEKEAFGFYFTSHPLKGYEAQLQERVSSSIDALVELEAGGRVKVGGMVVASREIRTKKGDRMAVLQLEDLKGRVEVVVFPDLFRAVRPLLLQEIPLIVDGVLEKDDEGRPRIRAQNITPLRASDAKKGALPREVHIRLKADGLSRDHLQALRKIIESNPGPCEAFLHLEGLEREVILQLPPELQVSPSEEMVRAVEGFLGYRAVEVQ